MFNFFGRKPEPSPQPPSDPLASEIRQHCCSAFYFALGEKGYALSNLGIRYLLYPHLLGICPGDRERADRLAAEIAAGVRAKIEKPALARHLEVPERLKDVVEEGYALYRHFASPEIQSKFRGLFDFREECARLVVWQATGGAPEESIMACFCDPKAAFIKTIIEAVQRLEFNRNDPLVDLLPEESLRKVVREAYHSYRT